MCKSEDINIPKDKQKVIDMMEYISNKPVNNDEDRDIKAYSKNDIEQMLSNIDLCDTYNVEQVNDFINFIMEFYYLGQEMGMSPFIARAALKELSELAFAIADQSECDGDCENCDLNEEHNHH